MSEWQSIDSAPTDGTVVLAWISSPWHNERNGWIEFVFYSESLGTWMVEDAEVCGECLPTHWMPLPEPPK